MSNFVALLHHAGTPSEVERLLLPYQEPDNWDETIDLQANGDWLRVYRRADGPASRHAMTAPHDATTARLSEIDTDIRSTRSGRCVTAEDVDREVVEIGHGSVSGTDTPESTEAYNDQPVRRVPRHGP